MKILNAPYFRDVTEETRRRNKRKNLWMVSTVTGPVKSITKPVDYALAGVTLIIMATVIYFLSK